MRSRAPRWAHAGSGPAVRRARPAMAHGPRGAGARRRRPRRRSGARVSPPYCVDAAGFVREFDPAPLNGTYMRVQQHIDDVGTAEVAGAVPSPVTWDLGQFTGLSPSPGPFAQTQRGYRDVGPPAPASGLQLVCNGAGFYIDPRTFSHQLPLVLEGPSAGTARDHSTPAAVSRDSGFGRVDDWRGGDRRGISVSAPFGSRCPTSHTVAPSPVAAHRTGHADFPHPALGQDIMLSPTEGRVCR